MTGRVPAGRGALPAMTTTALNRATPARQLLLERTSAGVVDAVGRLVAPQAQHPASPYLALWNRLDGFDPADLLEFTGRPRTGTECEEWLTERLGAPMRGLWWALRQFAPVVHSPTGPPWSFGTQPSYVAAADTPPLADEDIPAPPRLLGMWDSVLLAHADRGRIIPPDYRKLVTRTNGDTLPTLLVDGYVAGMWRPADGGIEATTFHPLPAAAWDGLAAEAEALTALLAGRDPAVYRRWWDGLPTAEVRVLAG